jgi:lipoprotein-anchoring transpeptidase ErfK/SrfK
MTARRVEEIAREKGVTSEELTEALRRAGAEDETALSTVDEAVAEAALLREGNGDGRGSHPASPPEPTDERSPGTPDRLAFLREAANRLLERLRERLRRRLHTRRLERERRRLEQDLGAWIFEASRAGSRRRDLTEAKVARLGEIRAELAAEQARLGRTAGGGRCPQCGLHSAKGAHCLACGEQLRPKRMPVARISIPAAAIVVVLMAAAFLLGGIRTDREEAPKRRASAPTPATPAAAQPRFLVASAQGASVPVYRSRTDTRPFRRLRNPNADGAPLVFLVKSAEQDRLHVYLPMRPNGSTGWIRTSDVTMAGHNYRVRIDLRRHRLTAWNGDRIIAREPVGVGRAVTPTPVGLYYITELLRQPDPSGLYGPYAFGLSAYSNVLNEFAGADGILGIHGTNEPQAIGTDVSHGCIRLTNRAITRLARVLPAGTPVRITRV